VAAENHIKCHRTVVIDGSRIINAAGTGNVIYPCATNQPTKARPASRQYSGLEILHGEEEINMNLPFFN
jgi:hypothetical protein